MLWTSKRLTESGCGTESDDSLWTYTKRDKEREDPIQYISINMFVVVRRYDLTLVGEQRTQAHL